MYRSRTPRKTNRDDFVLDTIRDNAAGLLRLARRYSHCAADAEDAYQRAIEIFLKRVDNVERDTAAAWLRTVSGRSLAGAGIRATFSFTARVRGRTITQTKTRILTRGTGNGSVKIKLSSRIRAFTKGTVTVAYGGDLTSWKASTAKATVSRTSTRSSKLRLRR
jgi:hypothetical protein